MLENQFDELEEIEDDLNIAISDLNGIVKYLRYYKSLEESVRWIISDIEDLKYSVRDIKSAIESELAKEAHQEFLEREKEYWSTQF